MESLIMTLAFLAAIYPVIFLMTLISHPKMLHAGKSLPRRAYNALKVTLGIWLRAGAKSAVIWILFAGVFRSWDKAFDVSLLVPLALAAAIFTELFRIWHNLSEETILSSSVFFKKSLSNDPV